MKKEAMDAKLSGIEKWAMRAAGVALLGCVSLGAVSHAQTVSSSGALSDIIVTAQRRAENLQEVPVAVTAFTADLMEERRIVSGNDLAGLAPSLQLNRQGVQSNPTITIRGISAGSSNNGIDPKVGLYVDGVYIGRVVGALFDMPDLERIEVLRGPQGTLFGRNATAGAISMTSGTPTGEWGFRGTAGAGNDSARRFKGILNLPSVGPLSLRFAYLHDHIDGYVKNSIGGKTIDLSLRDEKVGVLTYADKLGYRNTNAIQAAARLDFDNVTIDYHFDWSNMHASALPAQSLGLLPDSTGTLVGAIEQFQPIWGGITNHHMGPQKELAAATSVERIKTEGHSVTINVEASDRVTLKSITGFRRFRQSPQMNDIGATGGLRFTTAQLFGLLGGDIGTVLNPANFPGPDDQFFTLLTARYTSQKQFTQELQLQYSDSNFDLTTGVFYFHENSPSMDVLGLFEPVHNGVVVPNPTIDAIFGGGLTSTRAINDSLAAYGQLTWHLTDTIDVTGGLRYTFDGRRSEVYSTSAGGGAVLGVGTYKADYSKLTFTGIVNWRPNNDLTAYAKVASGYVAGGIVSAIPFRPETLTTYELGVKAQLFDNRLRSNIAVYYSKYNDLQTQNFTDGKQFFDNAGRSTIKGFEAELTAAPVTGLTLSGMVSYTDQNYKTFMFEGANVASVYQTAYFTPWLWSAAVQYDTPTFANGAYVSARAEVQYKGDAPLVSMPLMDDFGAVGAIDPYRWIKHHAIVNGRLGLFDLPVADAATATVTLYGKNILDKRVPVFGASVMRLAADYNRGRTWGMELGIKF